ncbi:MAG TPA: hypothetical protein VIX59_02995 [Candidatus Binataceae bacterium]
MFFAQLTEREQDIVRQCMNAIFKGPYIENPEFQTRLGINREALQKVIQSWPVLDDSKEDSDVYLAINNCLNEVCHGIKIPSGDWPLWFNSLREEIKAVYVKWAKIRGKAFTGIA